MSIRDMIGDSIILSKEEATFIHACYQEWTTVFPKDLAFYKTLERKANWLGLDIVEAQCDTWIAILEAKQEE